MRARFRGPVVVSCALVALAVAGCGSTAEQPAAATVTTSADQPSVTVSPSAELPTGTDVSGPTHATDASAPATSDPTPREDGADSVPVAGDADLAALVAPYVGGTVAPTAMGIAVVDGAEARRAVAGTVSVGDDTAVGLDARFHLGSDTKAMTAVVLAAVLAERGLDLSATLGTLVPDVPLDPAYAEVSVAQLLAHRSGIVDEELDIDLSAVVELPSVEGRDVGARAILAAPPQDPTRAFHYSNAGFSIAGWIAEQLTGDSWEDLVRSRLFEPLGMTCAIGAPTGADEPIGHDESGAPDGRVDTVPEAEGPAGRVSCSMSDWATWARAALDLAEGKASPLLPSAMAAQLFEVVDGGDYVSGWLVFPGPDGATAYGHDGSNLHWLARIVLLPSQDRAILLAANAADAATSSAFDTLTASLLTPTP